MKNNSEKNGVILSLKFKELLIIKGWGKFLSKIIEEKINNKIIENNDLKLVKNISLEARLAI